MVLQKIWVVCKCVRFFRTAVVRAEVELKHCRVAMLAALGFPLAEQFHPLFGGDIDTPSWDEAPAPHAILTSLLGEGQHGRWCWYHQR